MKNEYQKFKAPQQRVLLSMGAKVFIHASHPTNKKSIFLCEARIVRQPRRKDDERYKVVITGVQSFGSESERYFNAMIGMRIVRHSKGITTTKPTMYSSGGRWVGVEEQYAQQLVKRAVTNIRKDILHQKKNCDIPRLD